MLRTLGTIKDEVLVRLNANTTMAFYTDAILSDWINTAHQWASSYRKWPLTEGRVSTTYTSSTEEWDFEGYKSDSFRFLQVGGKRFQKVNFADYQSYREDSASGTDKIYSDFGGLVFINPNASVSGTLTAYGQYLPANLDATDPDSTTVFTDNDQEGNEAILYETLSYAKTREQKPNEAQYYHGKALEVLDGMWRRVQDEQFAYQTKNRNIFKRFDVLQGNVSDELIKRDQFY